MSARADIVRARGANGFAMAVRSSVFPVCACLGFSFLLLGLSLRNFDSYQLGTGSDDAKYVVLARSIAFDSTYGLNIGPDAAPTGYPFAFPLLLAPFAKWFPDAPERMRVLPLAASLLNVGLLFWGWPLLARTRSRWWAVAVAGFYAVAPTVVGQTHMVLSEPVFTTFTLAALLLTEDCARRERPGWMRSVLLGVLLTFALFTRTVGITLCVAVLLRLMLSPARRSLRMFSGIAFGGIGLVTLVLCTTPVTPWNLLPVRYWRGFEQPSSRGADPGEDRLTVRVAHGVSAYAGHFVREAVLPVGGGKSESDLGQAFGIGDLPLLVGLAVTAVVLIGAAFQLFSHKIAPCVALFELLYVGALQFWHWRMLRFLYPIQPFLFYQFLTGIRLVVARILPRSALGADKRTRFPDWVVAGACVVVFAVSVYKVFQVKQSTEHSRDFRVGTSWLRAHSPPEAVIMAQESPTVFLYTARRVAPYPSTQSEAGLEHAFDNVDYILIAPALEWHMDGVLGYDDYTARTFLPLVEKLAAAGRLTLVYESPPKDLVRVYRVEKR